MGEETCFKSPSKSFSVRTHSLHNTSVRRSSGVSVPRTAITTDLEWCKTTIKYAASLFVCKEMDENKKMVQRKGHKQFYRLNGLEIQSKKIQ